MKLYKNRLLRGLLLKIFSRINLGNISIAHHYTKKPLRLHSFKHKGYWYHGKNREALTMGLFEKLIEPGNTVVEVGGHIGYIATYFAWLVGENGRVLVFEPGPNNLPYLQANSLDWRNITIVPSAVGNYNGKVTLFVEHLTGQNNSIVKNFGAYQENVAFSFVDSQTEEVSVDIVRLDDFVDEHQISPSFIKIDVEGAEVEVVQGMPQLLKAHHPMLMIEFNAKETEIFNLLKNSGYILFTPKLRIVNDINDLVKGNMFALSLTYHAEKLEKLGLR